MALAGSAARRDSVAVGESQQRLPDEFALTRPHLALPRMLGNEACPLRSSVVVTIANPFADALLATGTSLGFDPYFLIQSVVPLASEAPEFVVVAVLVANRRPAQGLALFLASSVSQWTLAMGALPIAFLVGGGGASMPLDGHQQLELGFTVALTLFAVAALVSLRPERVDAAFMVGLIAIQIIYPTAFVELASTFIFLVFALDLFVDRRRAVRSLFGALLGGRVSSGEP
jgi:cation:H+ antiporter